MIELQHSWRIMEGMLLVICSSHWSGSQEICIILGCRFCLPKLILKTTLNWKTCLNNQFPLPIKFNLISQLPNTATVKLSNMFKRAYDLIEGLLQLMETTFDQPFMMWWLTCVDVLAMGDVTWIYLWMTNSSPSALTLSGVTVIEDGQVRPVGKR